MDSVVVELSHRTVQHFRIAILIEGADSADALPAGWSAGPLTTSDAVAGGGADPAGPMVDLVLVADDSVVPSAAQHEEVTALLQQVLTSNQVIVASNQAIAARITAHDITQRQPHLQGTQHLPMAA